MHCNIPIYIYIPKIITTAVYYCLKALANLISYKSSGRKSKGGEDGLIISTKVVFDIHKRFGKSVYSMWEGRVSGREGKLVLRQSVLCVEMGVRMCVTCYGSDQHNVFEETSRLVI